ncbi:hypothetical protein Hanom_Chr03g00266481 [Helianthus anomalus]
MRSGFLGTSSIVICQKIIVQMVIQDNTKTRFHMICLGAAQPYKKNKLKLGAPYLRGPSFIRVDDVRFTFFFLYDHNSLISQPLKFC